MKETEKNKSALVIFGDTIPDKSDAWWKQYTTVIARKSCREKILQIGCIWEDFDVFKEPGSIYEASALLEEISRLTLPNGTRVTKTALYKGYELWWIHYTDLFIYFCLPYTQYKKMLSYLVGFGSVTLYEPPFAGLFSCYLEAHDRTVALLKRERSLTPAILPFGILLQMLLTVVLLPLAILRRQPVMVFIGDKFDGKNDFDFRVRFIYEELRKRKVPYVEFVRSLQPWKILIEHAWRRRRPVLYASGVMFMARYLSILTGGRRRTMRTFDQKQFATVKERTGRFKLLVGTQYLLTSNDEVWEIRIMKLLLTVLGVRTAFIASGSERNFSTLIGCKLNNIPTVGILHGVASRNYNVYEFMPAYDGEKVISVDRYGLWSEWWKKYFIEHSKVYSPERLFVSGPMRPLIKQDDKKIFRPLIQKSIKVLLVSEEMAVPQEVLPYLNALLGRSDIALSIKFRPHRDGFETWLLQNEPSIFTRKDITLVRGNMQDAISETDVVVGCQSTGVLEAVLLQRVPIFFKTNKWGDYYSIKDYDAEHSLFAETPDELVLKIKNAHTIATEALDNLRERYFGDPYKNGSAWVVDQLLLNLKNDEP